MNEISHRPMALLMAVLGLAALGALLPVAAHAPMAHRVAMAKPAMADGPQVAQK